MKTADFNYILTTVARTNVLPIISRCNTSCIFCSHKQNPDDIEVFKLPQLTIEDFDIITEFFSRDRKIVIGESATRIIEGEPLLNKDFAAILGMVRRKYPDTVVQVTTNGLLLNEELVNYLAELGHIELNVSVNCIDPEKRRAILGLKNNDDIVQKISMLKGKLIFSASCVYVPDIMTADDIEDIVRLMDNMGAESVRIFLPGYTYMSSCIKSFDELHSKLLACVQYLQAKYEVPVILEPSHITNLVCEVQGVVKGSPSYAAGIKPGDVIKEVDGVAVATRVDAFQSAYRRRNPTVTVERANVGFDVLLTKGRNTSPGFIMLYDIPSAVKTEIEAAVKRNRASNVLLMTSELAAEVLRCLLDSSKMTFKYNIKVVRNLYFGGTIKCAGLLTVYDIGKALEEAAQNGESCDLVILPEIMFDQDGRDIRGISIRELDKYGTAIDIV